MKGAAVPSLLHKPFIEKMEDEFWFSLISFSSPLICNNIYKEQVKKKGNRNWFLCTLAGYLSQCNIFCCEWPWTQPD